MNIKFIEGDYQLASARFGIAVARFNSFIVARLLEGALAALQKAGVMARGLRPDLQGEQCTRDGTMM